MKVIFSPRCLEFFSLGHPESPERVRRAHDLLVQKGYEFLEPSPCTRDDLLLVHTPHLISSVLNNDFFDWDTPNVPYIYEYACLSAGGALQAMTSSLTEGNCFSLMRPPGHHATRDRLGGFCYFNNIAVAVTRALERCERVVILDFDGHHGNGTQDIFLGNERVLYISWHQVHIYPGTGYDSQSNCVNFPLYGAADHDAFMPLFEKAIQKVEDYSPDLIAVSAGFDSYAGDPLTLLRFEKKTYREIGEKIKSLKIPSFAVLEGGYGVDFPECVHQFLKGYF